jgi:hypothetical protein
MQPELEAAALSAGDRVDPAPRGEDLEDLGAEKAANAVLVHRRQLSVAELVVDPAVDGRESSLGLVVRDHPAARRLADLAVLPDRGVDGALGDPGVVPPTTGEPLRGSAAAGDRRPRRPACPVRGDRCRGRPSGRGTPASPPGGARRRPTREAPAGASAPGRPAARARASGRSRASGAGGTSRRGRGRAAPSSGCGGRASPGGTSRARRPGPRRDRGERPRGAGGGAARASREARPSAARPLRVPPARVPTRREPRVRPGREPSFRAPPVTLRPVDPTVGTRAPEECTTGRIGNRRGAGN